MRIALGIEYDGSRFCGWQSQPGGNTVQDVLEEAIGQIACECVRTTCSGRTDTGVHALSQVVHFDTSVQRPTTAWVRGVNANLPPTVAVRWAVQVDDAFHARYCARGRSYRYVLLNRNQRPGLWQGKVGWCHHALNIEAMREAAACLVGEHDFSAFRSAECQAKSPVKTLHCCNITRQEDWMVFDFRATAFLHHMVRNLVGALVYVGSGRLSQDGMVSLLQARDRKLAPPTFMADGLYFCGAEYDPHWGLPEEQGIIAASFIPFP